MSYNTFIALLGFAVATSITPGPNNFMLLASGVNFGFWRTFPHMCGIGFGFFTLLLGVGFGLGSLLIAYPQLDLALKVLGGAYMLYLAWKIGTSRSMGKGATAGEKPMTFTAAALFQWVNPKAWAMAVTAMGLYVSPASPYWSVLGICFVFALTNFPCVSVWALFGVALRDFLSDPVRLKWFNIGMAALLVLSLYPMLK
ncbi:LysE family translocator [Salmonella enterica subsp. enterica]|nr:LysE family translocator [Salmonella enterica subsp. enterica serovar Enteritidis]